MIEEIECLGIQLVNKYDPDKKLKVYEFVTVGWRLPFLSEKGPHDTVFAKRELREVSSSISNMAPRWAKAYSSPDLKILVDTEYREFFYEWMNEAFTPLYSVAFPTYKKLILLNNNYTWGFVKGIAEEGDLMEVTICTDIEPQKMEDERLLVNKDSKAIRLVQKHEQFEYSPSIS